ncbi:MAG: hypothetical protein IPL13_13680 [Saprospiraceae bacterium]|nr:hypothetical protein [Candidatus Brachybacter algidus]
MKELKYYTNEINLQSNPEFIEMQKTILAIDASNLLDGGGKTHLKKY